MVRSRMFVFYSCYLLVLLAALLPVRASDANDRERQRPAVSSSRQGNDKTFFSSPVRKRNRWVSMASGARPVYVGIQGGTAPVTVLCSPSGELVTVTGKTGNDFLRIVTGNKPETTAASAGKTAFPRQAGVQGSEELYPFGLSTPEAVLVQEMVAKLAAGMPPVPIKPLKLDSYERILAYDGSV